MVTLRRAGWRDAWRLYRWRTDQSTAPWMDGPAPVSFVAHCRWLAAVFSDDRIVLFVAELGVDRRPIGTCRVDSAGLSSGWVSVTLAPERRGCGLGTETIEALVSHARAVGFRTLYARIKRDNRASQGAFRSAGFVYSDGERDGYIVLERSDR